MVECYYDERNICNPYVATGFDSEGVLVEHLSSCQQPLPTVSIVMPVHNAEPFLRESLDSILAQTFSDWELLCIDDASTDASRTILDEYAGHDARIRLFSHEGNAGTARNLGIDHAKGLYLIFLDADDFFDPDLLRLPVERAQKHDADYVIFGGRRYDNVSGELSPDVMFVNAHYAPREVFAATDLPDNLYKITTPGPCTKLIKRSLVEQHGIRFQSLPNSEDFYFTLASLSVAERISVLGTDLLRYRVNVPSSNEGSKSDRPLCFFEGIYKLREFLTSNGLYDKLYRSYADQVLSTTRYNLATVKSDEARSKILMEMRSPAFEALDVLHHPREWYSSGYGYQCSRLLGSALAVFKYLQNDREYDGRADDYACVTVVREFECCINNLVDLVAGLPDESDKCLSAFACLNLARSAYALLPSCDKGGFLALPEREKAYMETVIDAAELESYDLLGRAQLEEENRVLRSEVEAAKSEIRSIRQSKSFRLGAMLTKPFRFVGQRSNKARKSR